MKIVCILLCLFLLSQTTLPAWAQAAASCRDSLHFSTIRSRWNKEVKAFPDGTWVLPNYRNFSAVKDTMQITYMLYGPAISFIATVTKDGCIRRAAIFSQRKREISTQGLIAMLKLMKVFNPEITKEERNAFSEKLLANTLPVTSVIIGNNLYLFKMDSASNLLTVTPYASEH